MISKVANRYARAVIEWLGSDDKKVSHVVDELEAFGALQKSHKELSQVLGSKRFPYQKQDEILSAVCEKAGAGADTVRVLRLLLEQGRIREVASITENIRLLILESQKVIPIRVQSAYDLSKEEKEKLVTKFSSFLGKEVDAFYETETDLIGGLRVTAAGKTYDGSLSGWLNHFEERLGSI